MKKKISTIIYGLLVALLLSCTEEDDIPATGEDCAVFNLSMENGLALTRAAESINFTKYTVKLFIFEQDPTDNDKLHYLKTEEVTKPVITISGLTQERKYAFVFLACDKEDAEDLLDVKAHHVTIWQGVELTTTATVDDAFLYYAPFTGKPGISITNRDFFGYAYLYTPAITFHTPLNVVLKRQIGAVKIALGKVEVGTTVKAVVNSRYYKFFLSQIVENTQTNNKGDYYNSAIFTYEETVTNEMLENGEYTMTYYVPYTTTKEIGEALSGESNYDTAKYLEVTVGTETTYRASTPFPIYRNRHTIFTLKEGQLITTFGIGIDDDQWDGVVK